eukprot:4788663-Prymnesium_polylepis.1
MRHVADAALWCLRHCALRSRLFVLVRACAESAARALQRDVASAHAAAAAFRRLRSRAAAALSTRSAMAVERAVARGAHCAAVLRRWALVGAERRRAQHASARVPRAMRRVALSHSVRGWRSVVAVLGERRRRASTHRLASALGRWRVVHTAGWLTRHLVVAPRGKRRAPLRHGLRRWRQQASRRQVTSRGWR